MPKNVANVTDEALNKVGAHLITVTAQCPAELSPV